MVVVDFGCGSCRLVVLVVVVVVDFGCGSCGLVGVVVVVVDFRCGFGDCGGGGGGGGG